MNLPIGPFVGDFGRPLRRCVVALLLFVPGLLHAAAPHVFLFAAQNLERTRVRLAAGDVSLQLALAELRHEADRALKLKPVSVMDKPHAAASGDMHDYFSYGPYWWPDPAKADGLPYIRRDGEVNPDSKKGTDSPAFHRTCEAIETLGLAYYFTGHEPYATKAAVLARVWFLNSPTRMNPNMEHAQAIPGISNGRGIGIIEARYLPNVTDSLTLIETSPAWTAADRSGFTTWLTEYYHWLTTSANGLDEQDEPNNHGSWYAVQVAYFSIALGHVEEAKKLLGDGIKQRIAAQIEPDGSQPRELARTKSLEYSFFNCDALFACAHLGDDVGVDLWSYATADGRSLRGALAYLAPYVDPEKAWPKQDLVNPSRTRLLTLFANYLSHRDDPQFGVLFAKFGPVDLGGRWRLLWPTK